jgi:TonB family protein
MVLGGAALALSFTLAAPSRAQTAPPPAAAAPAPVAVFTPLVSGEAPRPRISPQTWITNDDYPPAALRAEESGTVGFRLEVDETGKVTDCAVTSSSGSALLDATTCQLLKRRAAFYPAVDSDGTPAKSAYVSRLKWIIPEDPPMPRQAQAASVRAVIGTRGEILSCSEKDLVADDPSDDACDEIRSLSRPRLVQLRGRARGPVTFVIEMTQRIGGAPPAPALPRYPALKPVGTIDLAFQIDASGAVSSCTLNTHHLFYDNPGEDCASIGKYEPSADGKASTAVITMTLLTSGDPAVRAKLTELLGLEPAPAPMSSHAGAAHRRRVRR